MTRDRAKELLPIIKAYSEGKEIEFLDYDGEWVPKNTAAGFVDSGTYRIKPKRKLVQFTFEDRDLFKGKYVKHLENTNNNYYQIIGFGEEYIQLSNGKTHFYETLLNSYEFDDKTPCGKYV
jgi:hypothetical protein